MARPINTGGASRALTKREIRHIINVVSNPGRNSVRNTMLIKFLAYTGARISEAMKLKVSSVYDGNKILDSLVFQKTKNKTNRRIPINTNYQSELLDYIQSNDLLLDSPLFPSERGGHISAQAGSLLVKKLLKSAGIMDASCHSIRKFSLMTMLRNNVNLQTIRQVSGHKSLASLQHYLASSQDEVKKAVDVITI
jgi:integrase/recombinase XerD